jgi:GTP-binding protein LepA
MERIRNFCIIAHIDHGKSTLADRMMELTGTVSKREMKSQLLDSMDLEREKGITIKLAPVTMRYDYDNERVVGGGAAPKNVLTKSKILGADRPTGPAAGTYELNLIDTPGHVDFSYEVSRSLAAVEGAILVVDASQGIQAQTLANVYLAIEADLKIIPVMNKIDLPAAEPERVAAEIMELLGCRRDEIISISAKTGANVDQVLRAVVEQIPPPRGDASKPLRALIFDSYYDDYRGVVLYVRIVDGSLQKNDAIYMMATRAHGLALEIGKLTPKFAPAANLQTGEIGYIVTNLKTTREAKVGDTVSLRKYFAKENK